MDENIKIKIFLVDDDQMYLKAMENEFSKNKNFEIYSFSTGEDCLQNLYLNPDIVVLDYFLNGNDKEAADGFDILVKIRSTNPDVHVIMLSSYENVDIAVNCIKYDAFNFIVKNDTAFIRLKHTIKQIFRVHSKIKELIVWNW